VSSREEYMREERAQIVRATRSTHCSFQDGKHADVKRALRFGGAASPRNPLDDDTPRDKRNFESRMGWVYGVDRNDSLRSATPA
jgi:hypothetical protein